MDKIQDLRRECRELGLSAKGIKSTLLKRIHEVKSRIVTSQSDEFVDAMVAALVQPGNDAGMITRRKAALQSSVDDDPLYTDNVRGKHFVGNNHAMRFTNARQEGEGLADEVQRLDEELKKLRQDHDELRESIAEQRKAITRIEDIALDFRYLRNRFLSVYKRDKMDQENPLNALNWSDKYWVEEGNQIVHGGHCKRDAELYYNAGTRRDFHVYAELYGFHPAVVRTIEYQPTIRTLNKHASILSSPFKKTSPRFHELFRHFIDALAESNYPDGYLDDSTSKVTQAYRAFWGCLDDEVTEVERVNIDLLRERSETVQP